jgi:hypothetical protein
MVIHAGVGCQPNGVGSGHGCAVMAAVGTTKFRLGEGMRTIASFNANFMGARHL